MAAYAAGTFSGTLSGFICHPLDTIKVRAQVSHNQTVTQAFLGLLRNEGPLALWKGVWPPLLSMASTRSIFFGTYAELQTYLGGSDPTLFHHGLSGGIAGTFCSFIVCPLDHVKIRLQVQQNSEIIYKNSLDCFRNILQNYGIFGLYRAFGTTLTRDFLGAGLLAFLYNAVAQWGFGKPAKELGPAQLATCGAFASIGLMVVIFPIDAVKSRLQADSLTNPKYPTSFQCFKSLWQEKRLYRGITASLMRSVPLGGSTILGYELSLPFFESLLGG